MNCLRYWVRYVCKEEVKGGSIKNENESAYIQYTKKKKKEIVRLLAKDRQIREGLHQLQSLAN